MTRLRTLGLLAFYPHYGDTVSVAFLAVGDAVSVEIVSGGVVEGLPLIVESSRIVPVVETQSIEAPACDASKGRPFFGSSEGLDIMDGNNETFSHRDSQDGLDYSRIQNLAFQRIQRREEAPP